MLLQTFLRFAPSAGPAVVVIIWIASSVDVFQESLGRSTAAAPVVSSFSCGAIAGSPSVWAALPSLLWVTGIQQQYVPAYQQRQGSLLHRTLAYRSKRNDRGPLFTGK